MHSLFTHQDNFKGLHYKQYQSRKHSSINRHRKSVHSGYNEKINYTSNFNQISKELGPSKPDISINHNEVVMPDINWTNSYSLHNCYTVSQINGIEMRKAPSEPFDTIFNEIEESATEVCLIKALPATSSTETNTISTVQDENSVEDLRKILAMEAVKAAPPSKPPETPEEIAQEEEIQRKIRESIVIINPNQELALLKADPSIDIDMPQELRALLQTLTTNYLCKLCSVRLVGPQMAAMHYNGKNHLKKLRNFVQTNGRSAGFNMESIKESENPSKEYINTEVIDSTDMDEKKYCKICKLSFYQAKQAEVHYRGKNHAKKLKNSVSSNRADIFECKLCCVTVTSQEHLTAHLNGIKHKQQIRKMDSNEIYRGYLDCRGKGGLSFTMLQGDMCQSGKGSARRNSMRPFGQGKPDSCLNYSDEELMMYFGIEPSKKYKFDLANYRTPLGWLYCSFCDVSMLEESQFLIHLGSRKHSEQLLKKTKACRPRLNISSPNLRSN
ncbi:hypothetical protein Btru_003909 [Bulinus truncatus]|nr:hypothetical protein Btru_003909 [Bulinus truncatus]